MHPLVTTNVISFLLNHNAGKNRWKHIQRVQICMLHLYDLYFQFANFHSTYRLWRLCLCCHAPFVTSGGHVAGPLLPPRQLLRSSRPPDEQLSMMNTPDGAPCGYVLLGALQTAGTSVLGSTPTTTRKSTETKFESKAHKITNHTFMFANSLLPLRRSPFNEAPLSYS